MSIRRLFNVTVRRSVKSDAMLKAPEDAKVGTAGTFITPQSLMSFPVASSLVVGLWRLAAAIAPGWGGSNMTLIVISLVIGMFIWAISVTDPNLQQTRRDKFISFGIAIINSLYLAIAGIGISVTAKAAAG